MKEEKIQRELLNMADFKEFDVDQEWTSFIAKTKVNTSTTVASTIDVRKNDSVPVRRIPRAWFAAAASLILLIGCMYFFNLKPETDIDPILAEEQVPVAPTPEVQIADPEPIVTEPEIVENVVPKEKPTAKEKVTVLDQINIENKPFVVADSPKPSAPSPEYRLYLTGDLIDLSDGSTVEVVSTAVMSIPESFENKMTRSIKIRSGNAEFAVRRHESQPFIVTTTSSEVSVLGTTFRLLSEGIETTVKTIEGLVEFYALANPDEKIKINAGEEYKFDGSGIQLISEPEVPEEATSEYPLHGVESLFKTSYKDKIKLKPGSFKKSERDTRFKLPSSVLKSPNPANLNRIIDILKENFKTEITEGDCDSCYIIHSIRNG